MTKYYLIGDEIGIEYNHAEVKAKILKIENMTEISEFNNDEWYITLDIDGKRLQVKPAGIGTKIADMDELGMCLEFSTGENKR